MRIGIGSIPSQHHHPLQGPFRWDSLVEAPPTDGERENAKERKREIRPEMGGRQRTQRRRGRLFPCPFRAFALSRFRVLLSEPASLLARPKAYARSSSSCRRTRPTRAT